MSLKRRHSGAIMDLKAPKQEQSPPLSPRSSTRSQNKYSPTAYPAPEAESRDSELHLERMHAVNEQQRRLFRDPRAVALLETFETAGTKFPRTYYSRLSSQGRHILAGGQPAQTSSNHHEADFLTMNLSELDLWLRHGSGDKVILLRDRPWALNRPATTSVDMLLEAAFIDPDMHLDVQDLGQRYSSTSPSVCAVKLQDAIVRMQDRVSAPINLLNIECKDDLLIPPPLYTHCKELVNATRYASSQAARQVGQMNDLGKKVVDTMHKHAIDIASCIKFQINGQAGAISSWHMDNMGVSTWVTLEPNSKPKYDVEESLRKDDNFFSTREDESVLKLWAIISTHTPEDEIEARKGFAKYGEDWNPPEKWIKVLALTRFDTLIMPPGTIHAPITVTDCLFRGGMVIQKRFLKESLIHWKSCTDNPHCTNEKMPKQTRAVIDYLERLITTDPQGCGFSVSELDKVKEDCRKITAGALSCSCKGSCTKGTCSCLVYGQRCAAGCHKGKECQNPCGWR
ncbi:hypothetical protein QTJ16_005227 [Diplocarpon rosae]|uniref:JmjC domain-containing protein n=1 Tax=Diplocarpon rosae TaxID=946125 RepID=A0AAD9SYD9_9HELO|nr:hypothetical protein QTJ16_005227 [Diplocarpon rosae]